MWYPSVTQWLCIQCAAIWEAETESRSYVPVIVPRVPRLFIVPRERKGNQGIE